MLFRSYPAKNYWDGEKWCYYDWFTNSPCGENLNKIVQWRGITYDAVIDSCKDEFDDLIENFESEE